MNKKLLKALGFVALFQFGITAPLQASIFKCVSTQGDVFYNDKPCPITHDEESLKHIKDPKASAGGSTFRASGVGNKQQSVKSNNLATDDDSVRKIKKSGTSSTPTSLGGSASTSMGAINKGRSPLKADAGGSLGKNSAENVSETMSGELVERLSQLNMY